MAGKSTRITVDLGNESLVKALRIAAVEQGRTVRDIVVEALNLWLSASDLRKGQPSGIVEDGSSGACRNNQSPSPSSVDKDYLTMMETLNRYRGVDNG